MAIPTTFEIPYRGGRVQVEVDAGAEPVFRVHLPDGTVQLKLHTDSARNEHWWQLPYGETALATELGENIECCYMWPGRKK